MAEFVPRTTAPDTSNKYYYSGNIFYQVGYGMPNCTCYAWGRFYELTGEWPNLCRNNAEEWYDYNDGYARGQTPRLGAVICWGRGEIGNNADGAGHVAVVEQINDDGSIVTSNSAYGGSLFYMQTLTKESGYTWDNRYDFLGFIYNPIDFDKDERTDPKKIWDFLMSKIGNEYGVAGLMGNLEAESNLCSYRLQGDFTDGYTTSKTYTAKVNSGQVSKSAFMYNGPNGGGYGLAQWTYYTRKKALYEMWKNGGYSSIGSLSLALNYLWYELQNDFPGVLSVLKSATSVRQASDKVLHDFENPEVQTEAVEITRSNLGQTWYDKYAGSYNYGDWEEEPEEVTPYKRRKMSLLLLLMATKRK